MSSKRKVLQNSFLYIFSSLLLKAMGFLLLPLYTLFLEPEDYGITNLVSSFVNVSIFVVAFSLFSAVVRFYVDYKDDRRMLKRFYGTIIVFTGISGVAFTSIGIIFRGFLSSVFLEGVPFYPIGIIALFSITFSALQYTHQSILQGLQDGKTIAKLNIIVFLIQASLSFTMIGIFKMGATGVVLSQLIVYVGYFFYMILDLKKRDLFTFCLDLKILKNALAYSIPLLPHNLSTRIASLISRILINNSGTLAAVGLYSVASQFSILIDTIQVAVNRAFLPWLYEMIENKDEESKIEAVKLSRFLLIFYSIIYMTIGLFAQDIIILMLPEKYRLSWTIIPILIAGFSIKSIYYFYSNIIMYYKSAARLLFLASLTGSIADIVLAFVLIPIYGMHGSAFAFVLAKLLMVFIVYQLSLKYNGIGYKLFEMLKTVMINLSFMYIGLYWSFTRFPLELNLLNVLYKVGVFFAYFLYVYLANRKEIRRLLGKDGIKKMLKSKNSKQREVVDREI